MYLAISLVPMTSPAPVFDRLQYAKTEPPFLHTLSDQKLGAGKAWERGYYLVIVPPPFHTRMLNSYN